MRRPSKRDQEASLIEKRLEEIAHERFTAEDARRVGLAYRFAEGLEVPR